MSSMRFSVFFRIFLIMARIPQGVLLFLIHSQLDYNVRQTRGDNEGRILNILLDLDGHILNIFNIYESRTVGTRQTFFFWNR